MTFKEKTSELEKLKNRISYFLHFAQGKTLDLLFPQVKGSGNPPPFMNKVLDACLNLNRLNKRKSHQNTLANH